MPLWLFQSLKGIIDNWNETDRLTIAVVGVFQSLKGIIDNWNKVARYFGSLGKAQVSIPKRDY